MYARVLVCAVGTRLHSRVASSRRGRHRYDVGVFPVGVVGEFVGALVDGLEPGGADPWGVFEQFGGRKGLAAF